MAFKLRSGNSPMFKNISEEKETPEQYNARVRAEYEAKMQAYNDSTASYQNQVIIQNKLDEAFNLQLEPGHVSVEDNFDGSGDYNNSFHTGEEMLAAGITHDADGNPIDPDAKAYYMPEKALTSEQIAHNEKTQAKTNQTYEKGEELIDDAGDLHDENKKRGIYTEFSPDSNPDDLRPTKPREPYEMIDPIKIKNIDMGEPTIPDVIEPERKRKYITSDDGKWKYNLETGEKTRVKTQKVKKFRKPGKRSVRNLVTGGTNRVQ